jgi:hypothetical protein
MARSSWMGSLLAVACAVALAACDGGSSGNNNGGSGGSGGAGNGGKGGDTSTGATGPGGAGGGGSAAAPVFETDIVPIFGTTCGAADNNCHSRVAYAADKNADCRGWLSLEDAAIGSQIYGGTMDGTPTECPDMPLYERLTQLLAWEECAGVAKKYIVPCDVDASYLFDKIDDGPYCGEPMSKSMPPGVQIDPVKKETIRAWILAGAPRLDGTKTDCGSGGSGGAGGAGGTGGNTGAPPMASIFHPGDMETRDAGMLIPFIGEAMDPEDGALTGAALVWSSDLTGQIGTGTMFDAPLSVGTHVITLTATDSDGNTGTDAITLFIVQP